nr:phospholipid scramblase 1-like [Microcebus murinus]XP_012617867.1 phospholipid scramblase 1-like [Microcebus murinus]XP_012617868.1 phospholipid scramblase 1-like [Microcebus murinus]XP_012617869.1 phospholipid scramblase 1-like [Microcebus murinus]XP_012617870.1 phospholipid scramblase 1-like [Microcebus murinus]
MNQKRPPGHTGCHGPQAGYPVPSTSYTILPAVYPVPPADYLHAGPAVQNQPTYTQPGRPAVVPWVPAPLLPSNCPPGLEYLNPLDLLLIHQKMELTEVIFGFESNNVYEIKDRFGQRIYIAAENTNFCNRSCCGPSRSFTLHVLDNMGREVITLKRPLRCSSCCCPCCLQEIEIQAPPGVPVGYVTQIWHPYLPQFTIQNEERVDVLKITGPCFMFSCTANIDFQIKSLDKQTVVGGISKNWTGIFREAFTDTDNFTIQFPRDLDVRMKAVMLGACFLVDYMFFESTIGKG